MEISDMHSRRTLLAAALLIPIAGLAIAAGRPDETAKIKKNTTDFQAAWNKHDPKAIAAFWAKDGDLIDPQGVPSVGSAEVEKFFTQKHTGTGDLAKSTFDITKDSVRFITPDVALEDWDVTITGVIGPDGMAMGPMIHRVVVISKKEGSGWKIAAARPEALRPAAGAAPGAPKK
jgi:uncharacterized protein (TIGR02246 family)